MASSEAEDAAVATANGISLAPDNLEEEVAHLMAQELPVFDTDTDVAVASMLNTKLDFDEALLSENVVLNCGAQGGRGEVAGVVQDAEMQEDNKENESEDEDSSHYLKFSRTVVCDTVSDSDTSSQVPPAQISQLDGADGGSESDENEAGDEFQYKEGEAGESKVAENHSTPTKQLTVALKRLESIYTESPAEAEPQFEENSSSSVFLQSGCTYDDMSLQEEEVQMSFATPTSPNEVFLDSTTGRFVSAEEGSVEYPNNNEADDKDDSSSSAESLEGFKDDLNDPDYSPEAPTKKSPIAQKKTIIFKTKHPTPNLKRLSPKPCLQQQNNVKLLLPPRQTQIVNSASVSPAAATFCTVPCTVASPIVINGLSVQSSATRGRTLAIRLDGNRPGIQQQVVNRNDAAAANSPPALAPSPQVLLVNRQGQILIKDPRSNTYQSLSTDSPAYNKISQIAKILHSGNVLRRSLSNVIIKPQSSPPATNALPVINNTTMPNRKIIVRLVPGKSSVTPAPIIPVTFAGPNLANSESSTAQSIIDRAMATHRDTQRTKPIILSNIQPQITRPRQASQFQDAEDSGQSPAQRSETPSSFLKEPEFNQQQTPAVSRNQVRVKRVSSLSERPCRKKSKMDFLRDPSSELDEVNEARY